MDNLPHPDRYDADWLEGFVTTREASQLTGISEATLVTWRSRGGGPPFSKVGSLVRYRRRSLLEFMRQREQHNTADHPTPVSTSVPLLAPAGAGSHHE